MGETCSASARCAAQRRWKSTHQTRGSMRVFTSVASVFFIFASSALAQEPNRSRGQGYFFFALGMGDNGPEGHQYQPDIHLGAGGEGFIYKGLGVGAELGPFFPTKTGSPFSGWSDWAVGLGSANLS